MGRDCNLMTRRRFYAPSAAFSADGRTVTLSDDEAHHLHAVLRLQAGDEVYVFDGAGKEFCCAVEGSTRNSADLRIVAEVAPARPESSLNLTLAIVLLKGEKFDLVIQKATELGVSRIVSVTSERADLRIKDDQDAYKRVTRWRRIAMEAAKQSGRAAIPEISAPLALSIMLRSEADADSARLMFSEREGHSLVEVVGSAIQPQNVSALVGPEGGWTDEEIETARECGWSIVTLGGRTLRAETAAIAVVTLLQHRFGDLV